MEHAVLKRSLQNQDTNAMPAAVQLDFKCNVCGRYLLSRAGLVNRLMSHVPIRNQAAFDEGFQPQHTGPICGLVCKLAVRITGHSKINIDVHQPVTFERGPVQVFHL